MSTILIDGADGTVQVGPTNGLTLVGLVREFSVECSTEIVPHGPYIGDPTIRKNRKAKTSSGTLGADIPEGRNPGQSKLVEAHENGTNIRLELIGGDGTDGYTYVADNCAISGVTFDGNAEEGYSFEFSFEDMDGYSLEPTA